MDIILYLLIFFIIYVVTNFQFFLFSYANLPFTVHDANDSSTISPKYSIKISSIALWFL